MSKVYLICGKICSGKSTYAQALRRESGAVILSVDELMLALFGRYAGEKHDDYVARIKAWYRQKSLELLASGLDVILDWGFWTRKEREDIRDFYASRKIACEFHYIDIDDPEWRRRVQKRNRDVLARRSDAYFVDEGLAAKFTSRFEMPGKDEIDRWVRQDASTPRGESK